MKKRARSNSGGNPLTLGKPAAWVLIISLLAVILCSFTLIDSRDGKQADSGKPESIGEKDGNSSSSASNNSGSSSGKRSDAADQSAERDPFLGAEVRVGAAGSSMNWETIKAGTPRQVVLKIMGEPDFTLSGLRGDGYIFEDGSAVVVYYGASGLVEEIKSSDHPRKLIGSADLNRDGLKEAIYLDQSQRDMGFVTLRICDSSGKDLWSEEAGRAHAGWTSLFLCRQGGEDYLLRYLPGMWQGYCTYTYTLFTLEGGVEHVVRTKTMGFDINGVNPLNVPEMISFAEEVNGLLAKSTLLLSSAGGEYAFGPSPADRFLESYSWLAETPELYAEGDDLQTRLVTTSHRSNKRWLAAASGS